MRNRLIVLASLALMALPACSIPTLEVQAGYAHLSLDGDIGYSNGNPVAVEQDFESAFGLGDSQGSPYGRAQIDFGVPVLTVSAFSFEDKGSGDLQSNFGNIPAVAGGVPVQSDVTEDVSFESEQVDVSGPLPLAFLRADVDLGIVSAFAEAGYMSADIDDVDGELLDIEAQLVLHPAPLVELFVGYRYWNIALDGIIDNNTIDTDIKVSGLIFGGGIRF
jgi:hypothetical protein